MAAQESKPRRSRWAPGASVLAGAAQALARIAEEGRSADDALGREPHGEADRAAIQAVTLGSVRWYLRLRPALERLLARPVSALAPEVRSLLIATAHQVVYSRNAPQASVHAAVDAARILRAPRAAGLVNAVMRRFVAEREALLAQVDADPAARSAHPRWLYDALQSAWPAQAAQILAANNAHPPMTLRVDLTRTSRDDYLRELASAGHEARAIGWAPAAVELVTPVAVDALPGFGEGRVSVQDAGAQLAAPLLAAAAGMHVLDACAAPGGKTLHLLERADALGSLLAADIDAQRLERVAENLRRASRHAELVAADVRELAQQASRRFERVLLDAPCSSTGVIRRHPDIRLLRRPDDIPALALQQLEILQAGFRLLVPGGRILYCTCSVLPAENERVVEEFLRLEPRARAGAMPPAGDLAPGALGRSIGVQLLPGNGAGTDGFYYACLEKATAGN